MNNAMKNGDRRQETGDRSGQTADRSNTTVILRYPEGPAQPVEGRRSFGVPQDDNRRSSPVSLLLSPVSLLHFAFLSFLLSGCAQPTTAKLSTTTAAATLPIQWTTLAQADARPLIKIRPAGTTVDLALKLKPPLVDQALYFGEMENNDKQTMPIVLFKDKGQTHALQLSKDWAFDQWQLVVAGPNPGEAWGVLDQPKDDPGEILSLVHTTDSGATWQVGRIHKPCDAAALMDIVMVKSGRGRFTLTLDADCPSNPKLKAGLYHYRTTDGGKTWSPPEFEPDGTKPAEEVPEEEQIGPGQTAAALGGMGVSPMYSSADKHGRDAHATTLSHP